LRATGRARAGTLDRRDTVNDGAGGLAGARPVVRVIMRSRR